MNIYLAEPHYLPSTRYFTYLFHAKKFIIDDVGQFEKQSYRNRAYIAGANGKLCLTVPLLKGKTKQPVKEVRVDNDSNWQHIHWQSIVSAYNNSPFFQYLQHHFEPFYQKKYHFLLDLNLELTYVISHQLNQDHKIKLLSEGSYNMDELHDLRNYIHPKKKQNRVDPDYREQEYLQVFDERFGFIPGLSVLDLLFCCGRESGTVLSGNLRR